MVVVILMGVCGCGKTTVGEALAEKLGWPFRDADEFHSEANKRKMSSAIPLTDEDRLPWLMSIHDYISSLHDKSAVLTCSALKRWYRDVLRSGNSTHTQHKEDAHHNPHPIPASSLQPSSSDIWFVLLKGSRKVLETRLVNRKGHFMPPDLLTSQLAILEEPEADENSMVVEIDRDVSQIVTAIIEKLSDARV